MSTGGGRRLTRPLVRALLLAALAGAGAAPALHGQSAPPPARRVDLVGEYHTVSGGFGDWRSAGVRAVLPAGARDTWYLEALHRRAFGDAGGWGSAGLQHVWAERWYTFVSVGGGTGEFVLPDLRVDATLSHKWGATGALVSSLGATVIDAKLGYRDVGGFASLTAYLAPAVVAEGGVRATRSTPGDVDAARGFGALTLGTAGSFYLVARGSTGREGFQLLGPDAAVRRFSSHEGSLAWRQWIGTRGGVLVQGERYQNPFYRRTGVSAGVFAHW